MRRHGLPVAAVVALAALLVVGVRELHAREMSGTRGTVVRFSFPSKAIRGRLHFVAYLPPGYDAGDRRYPVVYFLHGLPAGAREYRNVGWLTQALDALGGPVILIAPQGSKHEDSDPEYLDWGPGRNWETAIARELPAYVDAHLRTISTRRGRALVGLSAGGYGAVLLALHHLDDFGVVESWSGYFHPTNPAGTAPLDLGTSSRNRRASAHAFVRVLQRARSARPTYFAFYVGAGDTRFRAENVQLDRELDAARVAHVFVVYPGAHERTVWKAHARAWLELARRHLAAPR
jgi:S-formylglutathione hydrolase FrmB